MTAKYSVYRNLRTKTFSLTHKGKVIAHPTALVLSNVALVVNEERRQRVIRDKRKNVHATLRGDTAHEISQEEANELLNGARELYYNPYKTDSFMMGLVPVQEANRVLCFNNKMYLIGA